MPQNSAVKTHKCAHCLYCSSRRFDLKRHHNAKHFHKQFEKYDSLQNEQNVEVLEQNVEVFKQNVEVLEQNVEVLKCVKCNKNYKTKKHLINHQTKCKGICELTCSRCMKLFPSRSAKSHHVKRNTCKARSVVHAKPINLHEIQNIQNIQNQNITNNIDNSVTNNLIINNFGSERIDHISEEEIKQILQSGTNTIPLYIEKKHFDKNFPENKNIKYSNDNKCRVLEDNSWKEKDIGLLSANLIQDNTEVLLMYCDNNEIQLLNEIKDTDKYDHIRNKLFIIYNKSDNHKYNVVLAKIKELIKSSTLEFEN
jgi:hypothetical protein